MKILFATILFLTSLLVFAGSPVPVNNVTVSGTSNNYVRTSANVEGTGSSKSGAIAGAGLDLITKNTIKQTTQGIVNETKLVGIGTSYTSGYNISTGSGVGQSIGYANNSFKGNFESKITKHCVDVVKSVGTIKGQDYSHGKNGTNQAFEASSTSYGAIDSKLSLIHNNGEVIKKALDTKVVYTEGKTIKGIAGGDVEGNVKHVIK